MTPGYLIYLIIIATGFLVGLFVYQKNPIVRPVVILLGLTLISEILSRIFIYRIGNSNPGYHFFDPLALILWAVFFYRNIKNRRIKSIVIVLTMGLSAYSIYNTIFIEGLYEFPDNFLKINSIVMLFWGTVLFIEQMDRPSKVNVLRDPVFIISVSVLWFYVTSFLFFQFFTSIGEYKFPDYLLSIIAYISNYTYYLFLLLAMIFQLKRFKVE